MIQTRVSFLTVYKDNLIIPVIRGNSMEFNFVDLPTRTGAGFNYVWNVRTFVEGDKKTGAVSQSNSGTLTAGNQKTFTLVLDFPGATYALNTKYTLALQLVDPTTNTVHEQGQVVLSIDTDSVDDAGQVIINNVNPGNLIRATPLTGLNVLLTGAISATDTLLQSFGKLQNQITNIAISGGSVWGSITGTLSAQTDLQNALNLKANTSSLAPVAISGVYNDLTGKPTIPTTTSQLTNDSGFITSAPVTSVAGKTGVVTLDKADVGLGNVDNTTDLNKPIPTATQNALNDKVAKTGDTMTGKLNLPSTSTGSLNLNTGAKPTTIISGDVFSTSEGLFYQGSNLHQLDFDTSTTGALSKPVITDNGNGTVNVASVECFLFSGAAWTGNYAKYVIPAVTNIAIIDNSVNYLLISYNAGTPVYSISTSPASVNGSSVVLAAKLFREGLEIHWLSVDWGLSTANRLNDREVSTDRYAWQTGLTLGETTGRVIDITAGVLWYGCTYFSKLAVNSSSNQAYFYSHSAGAWTKSSVSVYNNTQYDNGTDLATLSSGRYAVNWVYRIVDGDGLPGIAFILGSGNYTLSQAQASSVPAVPPMISQMAILVGRIIVQKNAVTATQIDSAFSTTFHGTVTANHNDLGGLQGGTANEYYHLTAAQLASIPKPPSAIFPLHGNGALAVNSQVATANFCKAALFDIAIPMTVDAIQYTVGAVSSGNVRGGIYQIAPANINNNANTFTGSTLVADSGSTAQGTALQLQTLTFTPITLQPGKYFMALMHSSAVATFNRHGNFAVGTGWTVGYTAGSFAFTTPAPVPTDVTGNNVPGYKLRVVTNY